MNIRYFLLIASLALVGSTLWVANRAGEISTYAKAGIIIAIGATTLASLSLAIYSLRSMSFLYLTRASAIALGSALLFISDPIEIKVCLGVNCLFHAIFFSERLISKTTEHIGSPGENTFIFRTPLSVSIWFAFTWFVFWITMLESLHLFLEGRTLLGILALMISILVFLVFIAAQTRTLYRRCVIVPNGLVASDPVSLTDVVLLPLAKIAEIKTASHVASDIDEKSYFKAPTYKSNLVNFTLNEKTDMLIARNTVGESTRLNVDSIYFSFAEPKAFVKTFHERFHKIEPEPLTKSQEKLLEKELGIETAPRSDSPLPKWRQKKETTEN